MAFLSQVQIADMGFASVGRNVLISDKAAFHNCAQIHLADNVRIDDFALLSAGAGGIYIGTHVHIAAFCGLFGKEKITLADFSGLSSRVSIYSCTDDYSGRSLTNPTVDGAYKQLHAAPVELQRHVIVGAGSIIMPGVVLQTGVAIGALSFVNKSCESFSIYAGNPLRRIGERDQALLTLEQAFLNHRHTG